MTIERLEELKEWFHDVSWILVSSFHAENRDLIDYLIEAEIDRQSVSFNDDTTREKIVKPIAIKDPETWEWLCVFGEPIGESQKYCDQCGNKFDWSVRNG